MLSAGIHGFILAFGLILPLGVQNVYVFNQGASLQKWVYVLPVVLTASICDTVLISLAVLGVSAVALAISWIKFTLILAGVLFLLYMGFTTWRSKPNSETAISKSTSSRKQIVFAASVSLLNPHAIMDTIGVIGTNSLSYSGTAKLAFMVVCILVSWIWFFGLSVAGSLIGKVNSTGRYILTLNKISALIMWGTAIYLITSILK
jgi:L-lysine exporter family protein LysE/ArgO